MNFIELDTMLTSENSDGFSVSQLSLYFNDN
jgi:hypothetical protein